MLFDILSDLHPEPDEFLKTAMRWHFSEETGSRFWLDRAKRLSFDPLVDITSYDHLTLFPNVTAELRDVAAEDLIPRGYDSVNDIVGIFETGGTVGAPKRIPYSEDWARQNLAWTHANLDAQGVPRGVNWLSTAPSGPHGVGHFAHRQAMERGGHCFTIDVDPRWVKKLISRGGTEADAYVDHLVDQVVTLLSSQRIGVLMTTPPILERLVGDPRTHELLTRSVRAIVWVGTHMDTETRKRYKTETLRDIVLHGTYGNTMILGASDERHGLGVQDPCVFDTNSPFVSLSVVDPATREVVPYGERGQVVMSHVSKSAFLPNNLERDLATRVRPPRGQTGDSVADIAPVERFEEEPVIEGVY
ncbi:AMP-binding protein [Streptomyces sp. PTM05]|uniref:AMP-binding protein n=1 Tax=Streptantibioticus parmotrematis TaxID=2873249 RepID=A0ABS7QUY5_9ACTN|nr:AMP-binding protein [Streptantibioticus parmotrematis]MBY8887007.1 AMP-binding protein [Streptantibioticus parmotrematis]